MFWNHTVTITKFYMCLLKGTAWLNSRLFSLTVRCKTSSLSEVADSLLNHLCPSHFPPKDPPPKKYGILADNIETILKANGFPSSHRTLSGAQIQVSLWWISEMAPSPVGVILIADSEPGASVLGPSTQWCWLKNRLRRNCHFGIAVSSTKPRFFTNLGFSAASQMTDT